MLEKMTRSPNMGGEMVRVLWSYPHPRPRTSYWSPPTSDWYFHSLNHLEAVSIILSTIPSRITTNISELQMSWKLEINQSNKEGVEGHSWIHQLSSVVFLFCSRSHLTEVVMSVTDTTLMRILDSQRVSWRHFQRKGVLCLIMSKVSCV